MEIAFTHWKEGFNDRIPQRENLVGKQRMRNASEVGRDEGADLGHKH